MIFSSGLLPWMFPSKAIFVQMALMASAYRLFCSASAMIGFSSSMAVLGSPLSRASWTFFQLTAEAVVSMAMVLVMRAAVLSLLMNMALSVAWVARMIFGAMPAAAPPVTHRMALLAVAAARPDGTAAEAVPACEASHARMVVTLTEVPRLERRARSFSQARLSQTRSVPSLHFRAAAVSSMLRPSRWTITSGSRYLAGRESSSRSSDSRSAAEDSGVAS